MRSRTIEEFVCEVERGIGKTVPAERRAEIVAETQAHLQDRAEDLAFGGATSRERAEEEALTAFGEAKTYAQSVAESFYEDRPRRKARKLALWAAFFCIGLPLIANALTQSTLHRYSMHWREDPLHQALQDGILNNENAIVCVTLTVTLSLVLGFLGRRRQTVRLAGIGACLFAAFFILMGTRYVTNSFGSIEERSLLEINLASEDRKPQWKQIDEHWSLVDEAALVFTSPAPIPAQWRTKEGLYPAPWPKDSKRSYLYMERTVDGAGKTHVMGGSTARTEEEARRRWRKDGPRTLEATHREVREIKRNRAAMLAEWRTMLARRFDPMPGLIQIPDYVALWLLAILGDGAGAWLGRWVFRKTWKKGPSRPKTGTAA